MVIVQSELKPILCAGLVCLDQVTVVTSYPNEDTDMRSVGQYKVFHRGYLDNKIQRIQQIIFR